MEIRLKGLVPRLLCLLSLYLKVSVFWACLMVTSSKAQSTNSLPPEQDVAPSVPILPIEQEENIPEPLEDNLLDPIPFQINTLDETLDDLYIKVTGIEYVGFDPDQECGEANSPRQVDDISDEDLVQEVNEHLLEASRGPNNTLNSESLNPQLSGRQLIEIAVKVTEVYHEAGYETSSALICIPKETSEAGEGPIKVRVIEGTLSEPPRLVSVVEDDSGALKLNDSGRLRQNYIESRLGVEVDQPLNVDLLKENLQLLLRDPLLRSIRARLSADAIPGQSILEIDYEEVPSFRAALIFDNARSPSISTFQQQLVLSENNLFGIGDSLAVGYSNTSGSDSFNASYTIPLNSQNGTFTASIGDLSSGVIESPFDDIDNDGSGPDIESDSQTYELELRQPIVRSIRLAEPDDPNQSSIFNEFALGLNLSVQDSKTTLLDFPFPRPGADEDGRIRNVALRFSQEWFQQSAMAGIALRSEFSLGLGVLNATVNEQIVGVEPIPDSRYFAWRGQAQWVRRLDPENQYRLFLLRLNTQLAGQALLSSEQFSLGGVTSGRGYRQDSILTDNGLFASAEVRWPIFQEEDTVILVTPFIDAGIGWNGADRTQPEFNGIASVGLGLQLFQGDDFTAQVDWGIPLINDVSGGETWQESGIHFSLRYTPDFDLF